MMFTEERIREMVDESIEEYGADHTHDFECRTWRGQNWRGACNCTLPLRRMELTSD